ncbi:MAG: glutamate formimidoyltransferase [Deinococcus sp.]|nr:glutamate formimidoyltransferase [Deinococcus sp.]
MLQLIECVPNFSEGRNQGTIQRLVQAIREVPGVQVLDVHTDGDHHRSVITFAGEPPACGEAAFRSAQVAQALIDLNQHQGVHPRMGAVDVIPFVPLEGVTMADGAALARQLGERIGRELNIPVFLYEAAATRPERIDLAQVRKGQFEGLRELIGTDPAHVPDFGPNCIHPTAGAVAIGARKPLIACNVTLGTANVEVAKHIARAVRHSSGGLRYCRALGLEIKSKGVVQVSMNLTDFRHTPLHRALALIEHEAQRYGVPVLGTQIVGLVPQAALWDAAAHYLKLEQFSMDQVLENRLRYLIRGPQ